MERGTSYNSVGSKIAKLQATGVSNFSIVYGTKVIILIDLVRPIVKLAEIARIPKKDILDNIEEKRDNATSHNHIYQASMKARHEG